eukprot:1024630-Lingulodinium_polyedra.AAC.1
MPRRADVLAVAVLMAAGVFDAQLDEVDALPDVARADLLNADFRKRQLVAVVSGSYHAAIA